MSPSWDSDDRFGFAGPSSGSDTAVAAAPGFPPTSTLAPSTSAVKALTDPRGSAIFWITAAGILGLGLVSGELSIRERLRVGKHKG